MAGTRLYSLVLLWALGLCQHPLSEGSGWGEEAFVSHVVKVDDPYLLKPQNYGVALRQLCVPCEHIMLFFSQKKTTLPMGERAPPERNGMGGPNK